MKPENLDSKFEHLFQIVKRESFLKMEALGGEIPFYISAYVPRQQVEVDKHIRALKNRLNNAGAEVLEINLYELCLDVLERRGLLEKILATETNMAKERFKKAIKAPLDIEGNIIPEIGKLVNSIDCKVVFLTGLGLVYPYVRSHTILNNLHSVIKNVPTVVFFPGVYSGTSLELFGRLKDDNYYRAFNIDKIKL